MKKLKRHLKITAIIFAVIKLFPAFAEAKEFSEFKSCNLHGAAGTFSISNENFHLSNLAGSNGVYFVFQPFKGNGQICARLGISENASAKVGLLFRQNTNVISPSAGVFLAGSNIVFERVLDLKQPLSATVRTNESFKWLRVVREGNAFGAFYSGAGTNWTQFSADSIEMPDEIFAGLAITGVGQVDVAQVRMTSSRLVSPLENSSLVIPTNILISAEIANFSAKVERVEFFAETKKIGERVQFPYSFLWTNALAGPHSIVAKIVDDRGAEFFTEPVNCEIRLPSSHAQFVGIDSDTAGRWKKRYGAEGFHIIQHATNYPSYASVSSRGHKSIFLIYSNKPEALELTNGTGGVAAQWHSDTNMTISMSLLDGNFHQVALYVFDGESNSRVETIEVMDGVKNVVLDTRRASEFRNGKYFVWDIRGTVKFRITALSGNAVVSGLFFDASKFSKPTSSR